MVGLCESETTDPFAGGQFGQVFLTLCLRAEFVDGEHDQGTLHAHGASVTAVDAFNFARYQAIADVVQTSTAVAIDGGA